MSHISICPLCVEELAEILAIQSNKETPLIFNTDWHPKYAEEAVMSEVVMSVCSSLIAIIDSRGHQEVQFSHFSVKEYLTSE